MTRPCRICVVGSANVDLTFRTPRLPKAGETLAGRSLHIGMGGKGANQAVAAARLGAEVAFVARVGNDTFGGQAVRQYQAEGIDTSFIRQDVNRPTGTAAIVVDDDAENCIVIVPGANAELTPADMREAASVIRQADAVLCQLETPLKNVPLDVMRHVTSKNLHIHSVFHCGTNWRPVLKILRQQSNRYHFPSLITHRMGLNELLEGFGMVTKFDECVKIEVVPHKA